MKERHRETDNQAVPWTMLIIFLAAGLVLIICGINMQIKRNAKSKEFITTKAEIVSETDYYEEISNIRTDENSDSSPSYTTGKVYLKYEVDGVSYFHLPDVETLEKKRYGDKVEIKYNPNDPSDVLDLSKANTATLFLTLGLFFALASAVLLLDGLGYKFAKDILGGGMFMVISGMLLYMIPKMVLLAKIFMIALFVSGLIVIGYTVFHAKDYK